MKKSNISAPIETISQIKSEQLHGENKMEKKRIRLIFLTTLIFVSFALNIQPIYSQKKANLSTVSGRSQAIWVFAGGQNPNPITDFTARTRLIVESRSSGVDKLYLSVYQPAPNSNGRRMYEDSLMAQFNRRARQKRRQEVWAAYGAPDWASIGCSPTAFPLQRMAEVAAYNNSRRPSDRFDGVILDVEPNEPQSETDFRALLNLYQCVRQNLPSNIKLAVAIRFFWDSPIAYPIGGAVKPVYQHIIDMNLDNVVVMGYRDFAGTNDCAQGDGMICLDKDEIAYASSLNKANLILVGIETRNPFPDLLDKETFYEEGHAALLSETQIVTNFFSTNIGFGGYAIHNYNSAYLSGASGWESPNLPLP